MPELHPVAILVAAASSFVLGGLWYSPLLFSKAWQKEIAKTDEQLARRNFPMILGASFVLALIGALVFAMFLGPDADLAFGAGAGFGAGLAWVAGSFAINYLFEGRSLKLLLINGGYHTVQYTLIGAILGLIKI